MKPYWTNGVATLHHADARAIPLPDGSVHCVVTSPPYWGLRDYGLAKWVGGDPECSHAKRLNKSIGIGVGEEHNNHNNEPWMGGICGHCGAKQEAVGIGLEATLGEWVANIVAVMREVRRVLRDDGTCWLNLGDAYSSIGHKKSNSGYGTTGLAGGTPQTHHPLRRENDTSDMGLPHKSLMGQPWRVAFALQDDGWILRSAIVWHKPNPMPESVTDRPHQRIRDGVPAGEAGAVLLRC